MAQLEQRWLRMPWAQASWQWLRKNYLKAGGSVLAGLLLSWIFRRIYRWRTSQAVRFRAQARYYFSTTNLFIVRFPFEILPISSSF